MQVEPEADTTVLQALRELGLTGTKEGCASGDCGACTVMVGEEHEGQINYHTVNACIVPMGQLAGKHLITIEGLAVGEQLHPAQQAMVEEHGSQCGYCTPGFVISLAALVEQGADASREVVQQGISGNLCRCTGYQPIVAAGLKALAARDDSTLQTVSAGAQVLDGNVQSNNVHRPCNEAELAALMQAHPEARLIAGGTDLMLEVTQRYQTIEQLIDLSHVEELSRIQVTPDEFRIGAAVPYTAMEPYFKERSLPLLSLLHRLGSRQIRNSGTVGGNLANGSPIADMPPVLIAFDAELELVNVANHRRRVAVTDFYQGYRQTVLGDDEYVAQVCIPVAAFEQFHRFYKSSKRIEDDISSVMGAFRFAGTQTQITSARIAFGGMAATPVRLPQVEKLLSSSTLDADLISQACDALGEAMQPLSDVRASATYRAAMARAMLDRALREYLGESLPMVSELNLAETDFGGGKQHA